MGSFDGTSKALAQLQRLKAFMPNEFATALFQESQVEATECRRNTPVRTGALKGSIHVEGPEREGRRIWCTIVAGGPSEPYAFIVHEDLEAFHTVGGPKYIERPLRESAPYMPARIASRIDQNKAL